MGIEHVKTTTLFERNYRKLSKQVKEKAKEKEKLFRENPHYPALGTHKLHGKDKDMWAFWINKRYRIKFLFLAERAVLFVDIGTHDIYK